MVQRRIATIVAFLCLGVGSMVFGQQPRIDITNKIRMEYASSIVKIMLYDPALEQKFRLDKGTGVLNTGSGVVVHESGIIFTNRHTIERAIKGYVVADVYNETKTRVNPKQYLTYKKGMENDEQYKRVHYVGHPLIFVQVFVGMRYKLFTAEVLSYSSTFDGGAIIKIVKDIKGNKVTGKFKSVEIGNSNNIDLKDDLVLAGFQDPSSKHINSSLKSPLSIISGSVTTWNYAYQRNFHYFETASQVNTGKDGGPVFDENGRLIGIIVVPKSGNMKKRYIAAINTIEYLTRVDDDLASKFVSKGLKSPKKIGALSFDVGKRWNTPKPDEFVGNIKISENSRQVYGTLKNVDSGSPIANGVIGLFVYDSKTRKMIPKAIGRSDASGKFKLSPAIKKYQEYYLLVKSNGYKPIKTKKVISSVEYELNIGLEKVR